MKRGLTSASHWTLAAGCWLLRHFGAKRRLEAGFRVEACALRGRRVAARGIKGVAADGRQEHQHGIRTHAGQGHRGVGSMPTHKKGIGRGRWPVPEVSRDVHGAPRPFGLDAELLAAALLKHFRRIKKRSRGPEGEGSFFNASAVAFGLRKVGDYGMILFVHF